MARTRTSSFQLNAWPVFTDALIAFVLVLVLLLLFQVARAVDVTDTQATERLRRMESVRTAVTALSGVKIENESPTVQHLTFDASALFASGSAAPQAAGTQLLQQVANAVTAGNDTTMLRRIEISGHTDNVPTQAEPVFTNWELSTQRASNIARYLTEQGGIDPSHVEVSAAGYGQYRPVRDNATEAGRSANRRIEMRLFYN